MYKIIVSFFLFSLFITASALASNPSAQNDFGKGKKTLTSLTLTQTGSQTLTATWTVQPPTGGYIVNLLDQNGVIQQVFTNNLSQVFIKLTIGVTYRVSVWDMQGTALISSPVTVTF